MSLRYSQLHARAQSMAQLGEVIAAMRGVAAARSQQSRRQLENVKSYADIVAKSISQVLACTSFVPSNGKVPSHASALLVFCAEHGFAGAFSEEILSSIGSQSESRSIFMIGSRGIQLARVRNIKLAWSAPMMAQLSNTGALADRINAELLRQLRTGRIGGVDLVYAKPKTTQGYEVIHQSLLPLDFSTFGVSAASLPPLFNLPPQLLLDQLAGEYLFAQLNEAIVHSYAAENLARLQTMTAARDNIAKRLETLTLDEQLARQTEITAEIIELTAGTEASITTRFT